MENPADLVEADSSGNGRASRLLSRAVGIAILVFAVVGVLAQFAVRLDYGPDEPYHLEYIHTLAAERRLPKPAETHIVQHPPLYYGMMAACWSLAGVQQRPLSTPPGPEALQTFDEASIRGRRLLRFLSTLLGCLTLLILDRVLRVLETPPAWRLAIVFCAALWPMFQYISAVVNNETASILYSSLVCLALVHRVKEGSTSLRQAVLLGALLGAATWIKQTTLFALPIALWVLWVTLEKSNRLKGMAAFAVATLAVGIWWPVHNYLATGDPFVTYTIPPDQSKALGEVMASPLVIFDGIKNMLETSFLPDWSRMLIPRIVSTVLMVAWAVALIGLFAAGLRRNEDPFYRRLRGMSMAACALLLLGVLQYALFKDYRAQIGGRYLLNAMPWVVVLAGASLLLLKRRPTDVSEESETVSLPSPGLPVVFFLLVLVLFDAAWWVLVNDYSATIGRR